MRAHFPSHGRRLLRADRGYSLIELMISVGILSIVAGTVMSGVFKVTQLTDTVSNRSEMHSGVRNATEFLQQEIGQAGKVALPNAKGLGAAVAVGTGVTASIVRAGSTTGDVSGIFLNEMLIIGTGDTQETVKVLSINTSTNQITADFFAAHAAGSPVTVQGGFGSGVVMGTGGSDANNLKIYGDLRDNGQLQYVEYYCDQTTAHNLYRRAMEITQTTKPVYNVSHVLLNNIYPNPPAVGQTTPFPCFSYDTKTINGQVYVTNVAVTLTVQTQDKDPITKSYQMETKALLNVSPRNVFHTWQLASQDVTSRLQPMPPAIVTLRDVTPS